MKTFTRFTLALLAAAALIHVAQLNAAQTFDMSVRGDFFAGFAGNQAALERAMKACEQQLAENPKHAEAMVWHGSGTLFLAGQAFRKGDSAAGGQLWGQALKEMDTAVAIAPENPAVLIPRGATLLSVSGNIAPEKSKPLLEKGIGDYEKVREIQKDYFDKLSGHSRGELLFGLADGYNRMDRKADSHATFEALLAVGKSSGHENQAQQYLAGGTYEKTALSCTGCHTGK